MKLSCLIVLSMLVVSGCRRTPPVVAPPVKNGTDIKENMINANRTIALAEETALDEYIGRRQWNATRLENGVRVWEYGKGTGKMVNADDSVIVNYEIEAINGKKIYTGLSDTFVVGRRQYMKGLDDAVLCLRQGSKAKVLLPSSTAYGIGGDGDRITQSMILVLDVEVRDVN